MDDAIRETLRIVLEVLGEIVNAAFLLPGRERLLARIATAKALVRAYKI